MDPIDTFRTIETARFRVVLDALPEDDITIAEAFGPDHVGHDEFDVDKLQRDVDQGNFMWFRARARVIEKATGDELGADYLGGCYYEGADDFIAGWQGYSYDMMRRAIDEARLTLAERSTSTQIDMADRMRLEQERINFTNTLVHYLNQNHQAATGERLGFDVDNEIAADVEGLIDAIISAITSARRQ